MSLAKYFRPFFYLLALYAVICFLLRVVLVSEHHIYAGLGLWDWFLIFVIGAVENALVFALLSVPLMLYLLFISDEKYRKPYGYIILTLLVLLLLYLALSNNILKQYGSVVLSIVLYFLIAKAILFATLLFLPKYRLKIRLVLYFLTLFIYVSLILLNALSEYFFWNEFGVRYNFIAVDYLIYTNEVIGNIAESYPVIPMFTALAVIAAGLSYFIFYKTKNSFIQLPSLSGKLKMSAVYILSLLFALFLLPLCAKIANRGNVYVNELQADGVYKFYTAFVNNDLNYFKFYTTIGEAKAQEILKNNFNLSPVRDIKDSLPEIHKNIVLITVESLSEDFLGHYGNNKNLTPFLDSLADKSLFFTNLYAAGNRTVRGLEALSLCIPPSPGESIIKQKDNKNKFSTGYVLRQKGYQTTFLYGGYSYFDNMKDFYEGNGYNIVDRNDFKPNEISFANIWGVCDEDMARKAIETMNTEAAAGKPFFDHWMTVSNHRPFTYPDGKVRISGSAKSRDGGVMYTDYALRRFFEMAGKQSWYGNTVFIIIADHCASSSGKVALPMSKYRIPCIVFSPGFIRPREVHTLMSQIDVMPTVFGLLHLSYATKFFGQDVLAEGYRPRAFIATYQDLGFIRDSTLTVLSPVREVKQYRLIQDPVSGIEPQFQYRYKELPVEKINDTLKDEAISYYQTAGWMIEKKLYDDN